MNILLIYPCQAKDVEHKTVSAASYMKIKSLFAPHAVAAIAALTPLKYDVKIYDEAIRGPVEEHLKSNQYALIGIHLTTNLLERCLQIGSYVRAHCNNSYLVAGGIGLTSIPEKKVGVFQSIFYGEAEETWPEFLSDFEKGNPKPKYRKINHPDMENVPIPRWDFIAGDLKYYATVSIQTTRGCPFDCNFCNVIYTYGRKMRCKTVNQIIEEVKLLEKLGVKAIFFADDNFIGNRKFVKGILKELKNVNNSFDSPLMFMTQLDITVAEDDELLELLADCNFIQLMIGIESVNTDTLKEMNKVQNLKVDTSEAIKKIQSYGMIVTAHMIIGFDNDTVKTFDDYEKFIYKSNITEYLLHPLMAPSGTKLWYQMKKESRIIDYDLINDDFMDIVSNILPQKITRVELMSGMIDFWGKMNTPESFKIRTQEFFENISRLPQVSKPNFKGFWKMKGLIFSTVAYFLRKAPNEEKDIFFDLFKQVRKKSIVFISRYIYMYTNFLMNRYRTQLYTDILKQQIEIEKNDSSILVTLDNKTPIPENILKHSKDIFNETYAILRKFIDTQSKMYHISLEAITDFINLFGSEFKSLDDFQRKNLEMCALRVVNSTKKRIDYSAKNNEAILPLDKPPVGFFKQMHNNLDNHLRYQV